mmetsp:Transcript_33986/g.109099  ORF Transcript_33986/g.109099 Transcript_33986/m.109099 type:complete len:244 (+) Transcript_33986:796-1527(+)
MRSMLYFFDGADRLQLGDGLPEPPVVCCAALAVPWGVIPRHRARIAFERDFVAAFDNSHHFGARPEAAPGIGVSAETPGQSRLGDVVGTGRRRRRRVAQRPRRRCEGARGRKDPVCPGPRGPDGPAARVAETSALQPRGRCAALRPRRRCACLRGPIGQAGRGPRGLRDPAAQWAPRLQSDLLRRGWPKGREYAVERAHRSPPGSSGPDPRRAATCAADRRGGRRDTAGSGTRASVGASPAPS